MTFPSINMRRVYLIARRDFLGYIKTWGFWISFFLPFMLSAVVIFAAHLDISVDPVRYETILDETGKHSEAITQLYQADLVRSEWSNLKRASRFILTDSDEVKLSRLYQSEGLASAKAFVDEKVPGFTSQLKPRGQNLIFVDAPASSLDALQSYIKGEKTMAHNGTNVSLSGVLHIFEQDGNLIANYWSPNITNPAVSSLASRYFSARATRNYLETGGLTPEGLREARRERVSIEAFDPTKEVTREGGTQAVTITDRIPFWVAAGLAAILWLTVFSGSYMLLTSMLEEKLNKLLEMMLASTRFSEIIFGKLIGVAALTITAMLPYILIGAVGLITIAFQNPEAAAGLSKAFTPKLLVFFPLFLILGYIFYGAFFIALGALAESMQDAQTLTTPIMLILTSCIMVVPLSLSSPDSPLLTFAAWFPISAPFANIVRLPSDPPWWELTLSALFVFILSIGIIWVAGRVFRYGVLSGAGVKGVKGWLARVIFRRKAT